MKNATRNAAPTISRTVSGPPSVSKATAAGPKASPAAVKSRTWNVEAPPEAAATADRSDVKLDGRQGGESFPALDAPTPSRRARVVGKPIESVQERAAQDDADKEELDMEPDFEERACEDCGSAYASNGLGDCRKCGLCRYKVAETEQAPPAVPPPPPCGPLERAASAPAAALAAAGEGEGEGDGAVAAPAEEEHFPPLGGAPTPARAPRTSKKQQGKKSVASQDGAQNIHLAPTTDPKESEAAREVVNPSEESVCVAPGRELPCPPPDFPPPMPPPGLELVSQTEECPSHVNLPMNDLSSSANGEEECSIGSVGAAEPDAVIGVRAIAKHTYVAEAPGYLNLAVGDNVEALMDAPEPGDEGCKWESYVFCSSKSGRHGWAPRDALWRQYFDDDGRPWLFHEATGDWCWES